MHLRIVGERQVDRGLHAERQRTDSGIGRRQFGGTGQPSLRQSQQLCQCEIRHLKLVDRRDPGSVGIAGQHLKVEHLILRAQISLRLRLHDPVQLQLELPVLLCDLPEPGRELHVVERIGHRLPDHADHPHADRLFPLDFTFLDQYIELTRQAVKDQIAGRHVGGAVEAEIPGGRMRHRVDQMIVPLQRLADSGSGGDLGSVSAERLVVAHPGGIDRVIGGQKALVVLLRDPLRQPERQHLDPFQPPPRRFPVGLVENRSLQHRLRRLVGITPT